MAYTDALRGYAYPTNKRDGFKCVYCGWDGSEWPKWLFLSEDHLLPKSNPLRNDKRFIVTACRFCNEACNKTIFPVEGKTPEEIVEIKKIAITKVRDEYFRFWHENIENNK